MIRQLPGGGLYTGVSALAGGRDQGELMAEMERLYLAGIHERRRAAGYSRHVRFERGTVRELEPPRQHRTAEEWEQLAGRTAPPTDPREIQGTFLAELFLAELAAAAKRRGLR